MDLDGGHCLGGHGAHADSGTGTDCGAVSVPQRPTARFADSAESQLFLLTRVRSIARAARAMLERYLLPVSPIVYAAMVAGWSAVPGSWRALGPLALIAGVAVCCAVNR